MKRVYFISGLGADKRVFSFLDLSFCKPVFIDWIPPLKNETLIHYALRLRESIPEISPVIVGVSFGGMLAAEMARAEPGIQAIIISSNKSHDELPFYLKSGKYFPIYKWIPSVLLKQGQNFYSSIFGIKGNEQKKVLRQIVLDSDFAFVKWAIGAIMNWKSTDSPANIIHIHGTSDILLRHKYVKADFSIKYGKHLMIMDVPEKISELLKELIG